ncbi:hypothetical protein GCM10011316_38680 [Roseibium aquae]|uniref:Solute-binding protein family 3/N-terminal domain-containing protein n=1 Tax=Roseibium aquae TaxID=1323746 RepID=A0A916X2A4_9HYPH|nr:transporter substrate-binding domain-containing protein [Roseibium aquae]GGB63062.1 hypothetical protein GCM10011316_38680 [Roseibium aquae]
MIVRSHFQGGLAAVVVLAVVLFSWPGPRAADDPPQAVTILAVDYPPFEMADPIGGLHGFDHEVVVAAFERRGIEAGILYVPWKRALSDVEKGMAPGLLSCAETPERRAVFHFSDPLSHDRYGVVTRREHPVGDIRSLSDLSGKLVAVVAGYSAQQELETVGARVVIVPGELNGLRMIMRNRVDYLYSGLETMQFIALRNDYRHEFTYIELQRYTYHLCFSKAHKHSLALLREFNAGLVEVRADGTYDKIHARYR